MPTTDAKPTTSLMPRDQLQDLLDASFYDEEPRGAVSPLVVLGIVTILIATFLAIVIGA